MDTDPSPPTVDVLQGPEEPLRDEKYFFDDGDCMFLVEGVLFKLHKWPLCHREPESAFFNMFIVGEAPKFADPSHTPLPDTNLEDFRALCWALYALPTELQSQNDRGADIARLVSVANMSHKYIFPSCETWALNLIWIHCKEGMDYLDDCPQDMLCRVFEAAARGDRQDLCNLVEERWLSRLKSGELRLRDALDFGEKHDRRKFLGDAYCQRALDMKSFILVAESQISDFSQSDLTPTQLYRLLSGYCSLSLFWERFSATTVSRSCGSSSRHQSSCAEVLFRHPAEPLDIIAGLEATLARSVAAPGCSCRDNYIKDLIANCAPLAEHFLGKV
ncbi:hypothetical protein C8R43DRAFT_1047100 [Mycena crocata]|nr:hypothetical protein C8R43DRAFT_1047100 [Mycena crocata]